MKNLYKRMRRLGRGVRVAGLLMWCRPFDAGGEQWQVVVFERQTNPDALVHERFGERWQVREIYQADLKTVRRIACGYYPSACRHFGPARAYAHL